MKEYQNQCEQVLDPDIANGVSWVLKGVIQPGGSASQRGIGLPNGSAAKTGTNENTVMTTAGFVPNQVAAFVAVADAQDPIHNTFDYKTINGVYHSTGTACTSPPRLEGVHEHLSGGDQRSDG